MKTKFILSLVVLAITSFSSFAHAQAQAETVKCENLLPSIKSQAVVQLDIKFKERIESLIRDAYSKLHPPGTIKGMSHSVVYKSMGNDVIQVTVTTKVEAGADSMTAEANTTYLPGYKSIYSYRSDRNHETYEATQSDDSKVDSIGRYFRPTKVVCSASAHIEEFGLTNKQTGRYFAFQERHMNTTIQLTIPVK